LGTGIDFHHVIFFLFVAALHAAIGFLWILKTGRAWFIDLSAFQAD